MATGRFREAVAPMQRFLDSIGKEDRRFAPVSEFVRQCERMGALEQRLPAVLAGSDTPSSPAEAIDFATLCRFTKRYAAAARCYADAFASDPALESDLAAGHRYNAACVAALAGAGHADDAEFRADARRWLRADLIAFGTVATQQVEKALRHWTENPDLASVREADALARWLPDERAECEALWADVAAERERVRTSVTTAGPSADQR
jgi:eukaryotic-like serine/threonine-protein kinase